MRLNIWEMVWLVVSLAALVWLAWRRWRHERSLHTGVRQVPSQQRRPVEPAPRQHSTAARRREIQRQTMAAKRQQDAAALQAARAMLAIAYSYDEERSRSGRQ